MNELITCDELCSRLKLKKQSIYNMIYRKEFNLNEHYFKPTKRILLFDWEAIKDWLRGSNVDVSPSSAECSQQAPRTSQDRTTKAQIRSLIKI